MTHSTGVSTALEALLSQTSDREGHADKQPTCCCASPGCSSLMHNRLVLEGLNRDVQQAAQIGQALVSRQNAYFSDIELERHSMEDTVDRLASEKTGLESANAKMIEENKYLLGQLEVLNTDLSNADDRIHDLTATLDSSRRDLEKLTSLSAQTSLLEAQLTAMEAEQVKLQGQLNNKDEEMQAGVLRWQAAERTILALLEQIDRIEKENRDEQSRHAEMVARLERRNTVQNELMSAAGKPRSGSSSRTSEDGQSGNHVVSTFVKEILQDNANLQLGIGELRDLLNVSNEEVACLREQALSLQGPSDLESPTLQSEIQKSSPAEMPLHVHHHYHAAPKAAPRKERVSIPRRPKKKRFQSSSGLVTPRSGAMTPNMVASSHSHLPQQSLTAAILSQTTVSVPQRMPLEGPHGCSGRQSTSDIRSFSAQTSPSSSYREQSIFDMSGAEADFSRPTTPASTSLGSPAFSLRHYKHDSDVSIASISNLAMPTSVSNQSKYPRTAADHYLHDAMKDASQGLEAATILEEPEEERPLASSTCHGAHDLSHQADYFGVTQRLRRANSAESIFSEDVKARPPLRTKASRFLDASMPNYSTSMASIAPITSSTAAVGTSFRGPQTHDPGHYTRLLLENHRTEPNLPSSAKTKPPSALGRRLGGWMVGKWGLAPAASIPDLRRSATTNDSISSLPEPKSVSSHIAKTRKSHAVVQVESSQVNDSLLRDALQTD